MDAQLVFRILLIVVAGVVLLAIVMHYNSCIASAEAFGTKEGFYYNVENYDSHVPSGMVSAPPTPYVPPVAPMSLTHGGNELDIMESVTPSPAPFQGGGGSEGFNDDLRPQDLLPKLTPEAQQFAQLYPCGQGDMQGINFMESGTVIGQSTNLKRNANLQLRSDPQVAFKNVSPWNMSTIRPDCHRREMNIGV